MYNQYINYIGWLGNNNLGDEALHFVIQDLFSDFELRPYDCYKDLCSSRNYFFRKNDSHSHISIFGGGTLLPDDITWIKPTRYNYLFGAAVKDPTFASKYDSFDDVIIERLKSFNFRKIGVRDFFSKNFLASFNIDSEVIGDPVLSLKPKSNIIRNPKRIGINVGCDGFLFGSNQNKVTKEIIVVSKILKDKGFEVILIPFSSEDLSIAVTVSKEVGIPIFNEWKNIISVIDFIGSCHVLIGQRLHSTVMSAAACTPFISIAYRPKSTAFADTVSFSNYYIRTDEISAEKIMVLFDNILSCWDEEQKRLANKVEFYRKIQKKFVEQIKKDINSLPETAWKVSRYRERLNDCLFWNSDFFLRANMGFVWRVYNKFFFLKLIKYIK